MMSGFKDAQFKLGKMIETVTPETQKDMGVLFNVIKNMHLSEL
jgi:hypothetical protein